MFGGRIVDNAEYTEEFPYRLPDSELCIERDVVAQAVASLKAIAGDGIPAELIRAGGEVAIEHSTSSSCALPSRGVGLWSGPVEC